MEDVATRFIASREPTAFAPRAHSRTIMAIVSCRRDSMGSAKASTSLVSGPPCMSAKPPKMLRAADPDPLRAILLRSFGTRSKSKAFASATVSAAKPEAEEAKPDRVGTLF